MQGINFREWGAGRGPDAGKGNMAWTKTSD